MNSGASYVVSLSRHSSGVYLGSRNSWLSKESSKRFCVKSSIGETSLSFLGLGLRPPAISWGVLLQAAQNVQSVALYPWLMVAAAPVIVAVLVFNFVGDGLRDAADPYSR